MELFLLVVGVLLVILALIGIVVTVRFYRLNLIRDKDLETKTQYFMQEQFNRFTDRFEVSVRDVFGRNAEFERSLNQTISQFQNSIIHFNNAQFTTIQDTIEKRLNAVDQRVNENLSEGFKKTNDTFTNIVARLSKIDEAQKKIDALSTDIISLQDVLTDKKTRGAFGEVQLATILASIFGEKNERVYRLQYAFNPHVRADAVLFAPLPLGTVAIDSKFPLENYRKMVEAKDPITKRESTRLFETDCKHHIDAIASKYIIEGTTSNQAILFLPAEAIFATLNAYHPDIVEYSYKKRVWIASPTTLMSTLTTIQTILVNMEREKYASVIHDQLKLLSREFDRYKDRWGSLSRKMEGISDDFKKINITTDKITRRFDEISNVEIHTPVVENEDNDAL